MRSLTLDIIAHKIGLRIYCNKCKGLLTFHTISKKSDADACKHPPRAQRYKHIVCVQYAGEKKRKTRCFETRNLNEAIELALKYKIHAKTHAKEKTPNEKAKPMLLIDCLAWFLDYKRNVGVKEHLVKKIRQNTFNAFENHITKWKKATEIAGENFSTIKVDSISDNNVAQTIIYLKPWSTSLQRKAFGFYNQFYSFLNDNGYHLTSPFKGIQVAEAASRDARALTFNEFQAVKSAMGNGSENDKVKSKIRYFDWLPDALTFNAYTGRRREEFMNVKFSDIVLVDGELLGGYIKIIDYKYSRQNSHKVAFQNRMTKAPIYPELYEFLLKMGYEKHKNSDRYIIAGDETKQRDTMANNLTNGFAYYSKKAGLSSVVQLNGLRKKYITRMRNEFGDNANFFTGHKSSRIDMKHYYDDKELFEKVKKFVLWKES